MKIILLLLKGLSYLPFWALKPLYWLLHVIGAHVISYRKKVIYTNLKKSFPKANEKEIHQIQQGFYKHFFEFVLEFIKLIKADKNFFRKNISISHLDEMESDIAAGNHVVLAMGHHGNWEYSAVYLSLMLKAPMTAIYKKLQDKAFEQLILDIRGKFGLKLLEMKQAPREMIMMRKTPACHLFIMDQSPMRKQSDKWITFLNQDTLVFEGVEKMAKTLKAKVYWLSVDKKGLGKYDLKLSKIVDDIQSTDEGEVIKQCYTELEKDIHRQPETWLWSHKRWKHQRK